MRVCIHFMGKCLYSITALHAFSQILGIVRLYCFHTNSVSFCFYSWALCWVNIQRTISNWFTWYLHLEWWFYEHIWHPNSILFYSLQFQNIHRKMWLLKFVEMIVASTIWPLHNAVWQCTTIQYYVHVPTMMPGLILCCSFQLWNIKVEM